MDKIKISFSKPIESQKNPSIFIYNLLVNLNEKDMGSAVFNTFSVLSAAQFKYSEFFLFTCSCGTPQCAGFHDVIQQKIINNHVYWYFPKENYYKNKKIEYVFDKSEFFNEINHAKEMILELAKKNFFAESMIENMSDEDMNSIYVSKKLQEMYVHYQSGENFYLFLQNNANSLLNKKFIFEYENQISKIEYSIEGLLSKFSLTPDYHAGFSKIKQKNSLFLIKYVNLAMNGKAEGFKKFLKKYLKKEQLSLSEMFDDSFDISYDLMIENLTLKEL